MKTLGRTSEIAAVQFVTQHAETELGSRSVDGTRRVISTASGDVLAQHEIAFAAIAGSIPSDTMAAIAAGECVPCREKAIGTRLKEIISRETGKEDTCHVCEEEIQRLNNMLPREVLNEADELASGIRKRATTEAETALQRLAATYAPGIVESRVKSWITEAVGTIEDAHFCWIYWAGEQESDEIRWSIRSAIQNFAGNARITIIGDRPSWFTGHVIEQARVPAQPFQRYRDTLSKIQTMIRSPEITGTIVWCMDDIIFTKRGFTLADIATPKKNPGMVYRGRDDWSRMNQATQAAVEAQGLTYCSYVTHLPMVVDRAKLWRVFTEFDFSVVPLCWESVYGARFYPDAPDYRDTLHRVSHRPVTAADCELARHTKVVLNWHHGSWSQPLSAWLQAAFPTAGNIENGTLSQSGGTSTS